MNNRATLLAYFSDREDAAAALKDLRRTAFRRSASVDRSPDGRLRIDNRLPGVDRRVVSKYAHLTLPDETLLLLEASPSSLAKAIPRLRQSGTSQPSIFVFLPWVGPETTGRPALSIPLPDAQIHQHALRLAAEHSLGPSRGAGEHLLNRLDRTEGVIDAVCRDLADANRLEQGLSSSAEWILDNVYILRGQILDIRHNLSRKFYRELPVLTAGPHQDLPRVYSLARELILHTDGRLDRRRIGDFLAAYQSVSALTMGELWAVPLMLRIALLESLRSLAQGVDRRLRERAQADFWANRLLTAARLSPNQLFPQLAELAQEQPHPSPYFASQLTSQLYDEETALVPVRSWLESGQDLVLGIPGPSAGLPAERGQRSRAAAPRLARGRPLNEIILQEQARQAAYQVSIGNAITSLRDLALLDWRSVFESQSRTENLLRQDPAGIYPRMDFETRDRYRHAVETISRGTRQSEEQVAQSAIDLAAEQARQPSDDPRHGHVGLFLTGEGRPQLLQRLGGKEILRERVLGWVYAHHQATYLLGIAGMTCASMFLVLAPWIAAGEGSASRVALAAGVALLPASQLGVQFVHYLVTLLLPPRTLPKMSFEAEGIPDEFRSLVVVPMILSDARTARDSVAKLEVRFLANPDPNLLFGLFSDFGDSPTAETEADDGLLQLARDGIERLNQRYGAGRYYLFHRPREWSETERAYIGWERKRGKLEELNRLLTGEPPRRNRSIMHVGDPDRLDEVRFVITLDSDTQLPRDSARRMVETLAHPLNQPRSARQRPDERRQTGATGRYAILQPRVSTALPSAAATSFSRLFSDPVGSDPYTKAVSDVYQDLSGEGSYHGKGIYDPRAFSRALTGRFPEGRLLSHDLLEGAHVRVGLASDIELFDEFPPDYPTYAARQHRWIRGDWQIAEWLLPRVPGPGGSSQPNPLSALNRWKVFDNLRRSLLPAGVVSFLIVSWLLSPALAAIAGVFTGAMLLFQPLAHPLTVATTRRPSPRIPIREISHDVARSLAEAALLPHMAGLTLDAIGRALYRRFVTHRSLLQWATGRMARESLPGHSRSFLLQLLSSSLLAVGIGAGLWRVAPSSLGAALPFLLLWLVSPLLGWRLVAAPSPPGTRRPLPQNTRRLFRHLSRRTWRYFDDFVEEGSRWLPPDNFQVSYQNRLAPRTSPTNIGLWTLSALAASDFGYLTGDLVIHRVSQTFQTMLTLERYEGHLLNWYDLGSLRPLEPRYVSSVDSGNLLACLWTLDQGVREILHAPLIGRRIFLGLQDVLGVLQEEMDRPVREKMGPLLTRLKKLIADPEDSAGFILPRLRQAVGLSAELALRLSQSVPAQAEAAYWADQVSTQVSAWVHTVDRYLGWAERLIAESEGDLAPLGARALEARRLALERSPSLAQLAQGSVPSIQELRAALEEAEIAAPLAARMTEILESFSRSQWLAGEVLAQAETLLREGREFAEGVNLRFLYDPQRRLFSVGYNVDARRLDVAYYDLLASESRLGSFVAIARGDVPNEHWLALNRPFGTVDGHHALLSWTGTMFEYLMPMIFQRTFANSLLDKATRDAVELQQDYARRRGVPWGMSESAYADLDLQKTYQYRAFGVPGLGLKRGLEEDLVVAPYATLLAVQVDPLAAARNLERLSRLGLRGSHGLLEAIDFSRQRQPEGGRGVPVHAFMAHHQAMGFLALDNALHDGVMRRRFHADPRVQASEPLLYERIPAAPPLFHTPARGQPPSRITESELAPSVSKFDTPHTATPRVQLLGNGHYSLMVTGAGGGYSQWNDFEVTRWRADTTRDSWGTFCYLRDLESDRVWSNTYHPVGGEPEEYGVSFAVDRAEIRRTDNGIETGTEIAVSPEEDVEVRRITLINRTSRPRELEITSYVELALAPHAADRQHPAFHKLFVLTEALVQRGVLLAARRPRHPEEPRIFAAHRLTFEGDYAWAPQFETDRRRFIGRGRTLADPAAVRGELSNREGYVLDPMFSLRRTITLAPDSRLRFSLVLAAAGTREKVLELAETHSDPRAIGRALELAWAHAQIELRMLRVQPDNARRFQALASHILYPHEQFRPPAERLQQNRRGQSALWPYGVSGDLPLAVVTIGEARDLSLVRQMLQAHTYWRQHGLLTDLLILNEESSSYEQPLRERVNGLIQAYSMYTGVDRPGGIFLRSVDQIPEDALTLILAAARISLVAARGPLAQQLGAMRQPIETPIPRVHRSSKEYPSAPLPFMELPYFNGLGGFTPDGREYAVYLGPGKNTPAPWVNVLANPDFGCLVSESGSGFTWRGNSQRNRLTEWSNDPVGDPAAEAIYLHDLDSGAVWTPTALPIREQDAYRARHGAGYTVFEHISHAIEQELVTFVPLDGQGGEPVRIQRLRLRNDSSRPRRLSVTFYVEWTLGEDRERSQMHVQTEWDEDVQALLARNRYHPEYGESIAFASLGPAAVEFTADRREFLGRNQDLAHPAALKQAHLSGQAGPGLDPCAALQVVLLIAPGQTQEVICLLGQAESLKEVHRLVARYREKREVEEALQQTHQAWDRLLGGIQVEVPDLSVNFLLNRWLLYQNVSSRLWARSGLYQSGGAFGFRDQLQDVLATVYAEPGMARQHILTCAGRQFAEGDVQHWWHPPGGAGVRTRISDDMLWLPYVVAHYVRVTGDVGILDESVPFLHGRPLGNDNEAYLTPEESPERASLYEHCRRAIDRGRTAGPHGLPLIGTGDWNDGMNRVGVGGRGESVWLAWFLIDVLNAFAELAHRTGHSDHAETARGHARQLAEAVEREAWDGEWYRRAYYDDGTPMGSADSEEARIDSLPQSWSVLCGAADAERSRLALESSWKHLVREEGKLALLLTPPFDKTDADPGYIKGYPPGVRENGGQYTHAALWMATAFARIGDADRAVRLLRMLNPVEHSRDPKAVERYRVEPYVVASDVYDLAGHEGMGGWTWYTGSAAWMYRVWVEEILGLHIRGEILRLNPVIPADWKGFTLRYRNGQAVYEITVENPDGATRGVSWVEVDGERKPDPSITLERGLIKHRVRVRMGPPPQ